MANYLREHGKPII